MSSLSPILCLACTVFSFLSFCHSLPLSCRQGQQIGLSSPVCSRASPLQVSLSLGLVLGTSTSYDTQRFTLPYAQPPLKELRFASPQPIVTPLNKTRVYDATSLPRACMQVADSTYGISDDNMSEDCLYLNIYRPSTSVLTPAKPVLVWIHGGSFISGSSTAPGLDGSYLASKNEVIVVTVQYRLGMFGFFSPDSLLNETSMSSDKLNGNQGLRDVVLALKFLHDNISKFGGDPKQITVAGQSSGAHMIRALLSVSEAQPLFQRAILHSDPANFGTQSKTTSNIVSTFALNQSGCQDIACLRSSSAADLLQYSTTAVSAAQSLDASIALGEVWRPFADSYVGALFENNPAASLAAKTGKSIIMTTVANEGGSVVGQMLQSTSAQVYSATLKAYPVTLNRSQLIAQMFNGGRSNTIDTCSQYSMNSSLFSGNDGLRMNIEDILTQGQFTCPTWYNARRFASNGGVYVAEFRKGIPYVSNTDNDYCSGKVCHEDDILTVFTDPDTTNQKALVQEVQARWINFVKTGLPNTKAYPGWTPVSSAADTINVLQLGASGAASSSVQAISLTSGQYAGCGQVWNNLIRYDWQMYG